MCNLKLRWLLIPLLFIIIFLVVFFWNTIIMFIAPKAVLSSALTKAFEKLDERFSDSPLWIIAEGYDEGGCNTIQMKLDTANDLVGDIRYDMTIQTDVLNHQLTASGAAETSSGSLNMSVYMDTDFVALTSEELLKGGYYGITYDTFSSDIQTFPLLSFLIPNSTIQEWESSLKGVQAFMGRSVQLPQLPEITEEDMKMLMLGVLALKSEVEVENVGMGTKNLSCYKIVYSETGDQVRALLSNVLDIADQENAEIRAAFWLYEETVVQAEVTATAGMNQLGGKFLLGMDASVDDLTMTISKEENRKKESFSAVVSTKREGERYIETILLNDVTVTYDWKPDSGEMKLFIRNCETIELKLLPAKDGFRIETEDLMELLDLNSDAEYDCVMTIAKGSSISTPSYKNIDEWSFSDLMILLSGMGSLLGFHAG